MTILGHGEGVRLDRVLRRPRSRNALDFALTFGDRIRIGAVEILVERPTDDALPTRMNLVPVDWKLGE